jgi:hypothetical protein
MERRRARSALHVMNDHDDDILDRATDRFERRLSDECGTLRAETAALRADMNKELGGLRADMNKGFGDLRAEMIERMSEFIKWNAAFWVAGLAAIAGLLVLIG